MQHSIGLALNCREEYSVRALHFWIQSESLFAVRTGPKREDF